jgi:ABC-2 type transport system permease protein
MSTFRVIADREIRLALRNRSIFITAVIFAIWFPVMSAFGVAAGAGGDAAALAAGIAAIILPNRGIHGLHLLRRRLPPREAGRHHRDAPLHPGLPPPPLGGEGRRGRRAGLPDDPRLGRSDRSRPVSTLTGIPVAAEPLLLLHLAVIVPVWVVASAGLIGAAQLALGMRENQILGFAFIFGFIFLIGGLQAVVSDGSGISATAEAVLAVAGVALVALARFIAGKVTKERIVRTIP